MRELLLSLIGIIWLFGSADAQTKRAFVAGIDQYDELTDLTRAEEDAQGYARVLNQNLGFSVTELTGDRTRTDFNRAFGAFIESIEPGDQVVFVFSGHGWSDGAENFLALRDAPKSASEFELKEDTIALSRTILRRIKDRNPALLIAIIDACRDNPFDSGGRNGFEKGLVRVEALEGTAVVFAAGERQEARDRLDEKDKVPYSVFTRALLPRLSNPNLPLMQAFDEVRDEVEAQARAKGHKQRPAIMSDVSMRFCFSGNCTVPGPDAETTLWNRISATQSSADQCAGYDDYLKQYNAGRYATSARSLTATLCGAAAVPLTSSMVSNRLPPGDEFRDPLSGGRFGPQMVVIEAGEFVMGSPTTPTNPTTEEGRDEDEGPTRTVRIGYEFAVGKYEVTWSEWEACVADGECNNPPVIETSDPEIRETEAHPVVNVSWDDAKAYVAWLTAATGHTYRLLSEAEWEYAARARTTTPFSFGATISTSQANYDGNYVYGAGVPGEFRRQTLPVGGFDANAFGLEDMHGNVWEWVEDCHESGYVAHPSDGRAFTKRSCSTRVFRGGSCCNPPQFLRSASRYHARKEYKNYAVGFRVARELR